MEFIEYFYIRKREIAIRMKKIGKKLFIGALIIGCSQSYISSSFAKNIGIVPQPKELNQGNGYFNLAGCDEILVSELNEDTKKIAALLNKFVNKAKCANIPVNTVKNPSAKTRIVIDYRQELPLKNEAYNLIVLQNQIKIQASSVSGLFYAVQTLRQLLPNEIEKKTLQKAQLKIPVVKINDAPRYPWRGLMLDESRHFFGKKVVKKLLDAMVFYKLNRFHWHLTDTDGWRFEVAKYPKLTTIGALGDLSNPNGKAQFYTKKDILEIIKYAEERHIMIIPEIDMPGHARAAAKAYPEISGGGSKKYPDFTFNPGKKETYKFLENVLTEVSELFPSPYIHYGGDEVHFANKQWLTDKNVQALMKKYKLKNLREVEWFFNRKMSKYINKINRKTVAWDEVVAANVPPNEAVMMWWRHDKINNLKRSLSKGYEVVLCPRLPMYFDFLQANNHKSGRRWGDPGIADLPLVYNFPAFIAKYPLKQRKQILGVQGNIWSEKIKSNERLYFMTFPRIAGLAASAWTLQQNKDYPKFLKTLEQHFKRYDTWGINYYNVINPQLTKEVQFKK